MKPIIFDVQSFGPWQRSDLPRHQPLGILQLVESGQLARVPFQAHATRRRPLDRFLVDKAEVDAFIENKERERR